MTSLSGWGMKITKEELKRELVRIDETVNMDEAEKEEAKIKLQTDTQ
jgi:predicted GIY-YIG superfamily endonuclease